MFLESSKKSVPSLTVIVVKKSVDRADRCPERFRPYDSPFAQNGRSRWIDFLQRFKDRDGDLGRHALLVNALVFIVLKR